MPLLVFSVTAALAQSASISGRVSDPSQGVVRDAQIVLTNDQTGVAQRSKSNDAGAYLISPIQPGKYTVVAEAAGFKQLKRTNITVETAQDLELNLALQVGDAKDSVTVNGSGIPVNTVDASVTTVIDRQFVENIPMNGRSFQSLISAVPGVNYTPAGNGSGYGGGLTVNGQRTEENYFTLDGVSLNAGQELVNGGGGYGAGYSGFLPNLTALGTTQSLLSLDSLEEFRAITSTYSSEYGRTPGGQFVLTSRSGTNAYHGSAYDYFRNGDLDAANWFNNSSGTPQQPEHQNDFGGTFGGPAWIPGIYNGADKTFFFFSYEGLRLTSPIAAQTYYVPDLSLRQQAPEALRFILNSYPLPTGPALGNGLAPYVAGFTSPSSIDAVGVRIDHNFNDKFRVFGRYSRTPSSIQSPTTAGNTAGILVNALLDKTQTVTIGAASSLSTKLSNDFRFGFTATNHASSYSFTGLGGATIPDLAQEIPGYSNNYGLSTGLFFGGVNAGYYFYPGGNRQRQINVTDSFDYLAGRHNLKWGIDYRRTATREPQYALAEFALYFSEDAALSNATGYGDLRSDPFIVNPIYTQFAAFVQDEWKVNNRLSLSLGLRWEYAPPPTDGTGNNPYTVTQIDDLSTTVLAPKGTPLWKTTYKNFAPRLGLAYQLNQSPGRETVLRTGFGIYYDTANPEGSIGYNAVGETASLNVSGSPFPFTQEQVSAIGAPSAAAPYNYQVNSFDPNLRLPYTLQWSMALEQKLGQKQTFTVSYVGNGGRRLFISNYDDPGLLGNPAFSSGNYLVVVTNGSASSYNALQAKFQSQLSHGLQVLASYSWAHSLDDLSTNFLVSERQRASSDFDVRHNFQAALSYNIPGSYQNKLASALLKHWSVDARINARSGLPIDVEGAFGYSSVTGQQATYHPNAVPGQPTYLYGGNYPGGRAINVNAFSEALDSAGNDVEGNLGRNTARGLDLVQVDATLQRSFRLTERFGLQFRAEVFNLFNHPIFGDIYNYIGIPSRFGVAEDTANTQLGVLNPLYQVGGPRSLQLMLKLSF